MCISDQAMAKSLSAADPLPMTCSKMIGVLFFFLSQEDVYIEEIFSGVISVIETLHGFG